MVNVLPYLFGKFSQMVYNLAPTGELLEPLHPRGQWPKTLDTAMERPDTITIRHALFSNNYVAADYYHIFYCQ